MKKRVISFLLSINLLITLLCTRLWSITTEPQSASVLSGVRVKDIDYARGMIYDRNLTPLVNNAYTRKLLIKPTTNALNVLKATGYDNNTLMKAANGYLVIADSDKATQINTADIKVTEAFDRYGDNTLLHIIGYTDLNNNGVCGIEACFDEYLKSCGGTLSVAYNADATGRVLLSEDIEIRNNGYYDKDGIVLTIDKRIQEITENALKNNDITKGAAVVIDVSGGEILACASVPVYDRSNLSEYLERSDSPFINRAFTAYPLGSVFKVITSAAAMENGITPPDYYCTGSIVKSNTRFNCNNTNGHGYTDFKTAIIKSCNPYFIELGVQTGGEAILTTAKKLGLGTSIDLGNGLRTSAGILPEKEDLNSQAATGNFAFGQGKLTSTPLHIASLMTTLANDGYIKELKLVAGFTDKKGNFTPNLEGKSKQALKKETCDILKEAMKETVINGTGKSAFSSLYTCCAKSATAQSGQFNPDGTEIMYCWFAGFLPADNPEYVVCIMKENGSSGGQDCGPVFKEIAEQIIALERSKKQPDNSTTYPR